MPRWICFNHQRTIIFDSSSNNPRCPECKCDDIAVYSGTRPPTSLAERKAMEKEIRPLANPKPNKKSVPAVKKETKKEVEQDEKPKNGRWF